MTENAAFTPHLVDALRWLGDAAALPLPAVVALALLPALIGLWSGSLLAFAAVTALNLAAVAALWFGAGAAAEVLVGGACLAGAFALACMARREALRARDVARLAREVAALNGQMRDYLEALHARSDAVEQRAMEAAKRYEVEVTRVRPTAAAPVAAAV